MRWRAGNRVGCSLSSSVNLGLEDSCEKSIFCLIYLGGGAGGGGWGISGGSGCERLIELASEASWDGLCCLKQAIEQLMEVRGTAGECGENARTRESSNGGTCISSVPRCRCHMYCWPYLTSESRSQLCSPSANSICAENGEVRVRPASLRGHVVG
jgi:hypothetical protein